jgi:hypothetical protein
MHHTPRSTTNRHNTPHGTPRAQATSWDPDPDVPYIEVTVLKSNRMVGLKVAPFIGPPSSLHPSVFCPSCESVVWGKNSVLPPPTSSRCHPPRAWLHYIILRGRGSTTNARSHARTQNCEWCPWRGTRVVRLCPQSRRTVPRRPTRCTHLSSPRSRTCARTLHSRAGWQRPRALGVSVCPNDWGGHPHR